MTRRDSSMFMTRLWLDLKKIRKFLIRLGVKVFAVGLWVAVAPSSARHWNVHFFSLGSYEINADRWLRNIALDVYKICLIFALQWKKQFKTWNTKKCCKRSEKKIQPSLEGCGVTAVFHVNLLVLRCVTSSREDFPYHNGRYRSQTKF